MDPENRNKRDLPEVVADILITLDKIVERQDRTDQTLEQMRQQMNEGCDRLSNSFDKMTTAVLDAMNRQTERYDRTAETQASQQTEVRELKQRVENLEKTVYNKTS